MTEHRKPWEDLANAIIYRAVGDYRRAARNLLKNPTDEMALAEIQTIERFFKSAFYYKLMSVDGEILLQILHKEMENAKMKKAKKPKSKKSRKSNINRRVSK